MKKLWMAITVSGLAILFAASANLASADARLEERLITLSNRLAALVQTKVRDLSDGEQQQLLATLLEARRIINRGADDPDDRPGDIYTDRVEIGPVSRRSGGEVVVAALVSPVELNSLTVSLYSRTQQSRVRIMEAVAVTDRGSHILHELRGTDLTNGGRKVVT